MSFYRRQETPITTRRIGISSKFSGVCWNPEALPRENAQVELARSKISPIIEKTQIIELNN
jgi:hypothetical protein